MVAPDRVPSMGQIEQTMGKQKTDIKLLLSHSNNWNYLTVCKKMINSKNNYSYTIEILETICI